MASGEQYRTYDSAGRNYAHEGVPGVLEHVSGGSAAWSNSGCGSAVLEPDFSVEAEQEKTDSDRLEYYESLG